jgi:hypothetical protein
MKAKSGMIATGAAAAACFILAAAAAANTPGEAPATLPGVVVRGKAGNLIGSAPAASKGQASGAELLARPLARRGEMLETVPGMIVTQHAGDGKANQYFLRGFNLDHGTDFGVFLDGVPLNLRTHAHGQGYIDLNVVIPELVAEVESFKGPYFAEWGDLTTAGAANFRYHEVLPESLASLTFGENNYFRGLVAHTFNAGEGHLTAALEGTSYDGPWQLSQDALSWNGFLRYHRALAESAWSLSYTGYDAEWTSSDQIPQRAIRDGRLDRFGHVDPSNGGDSARHAGVFAWRGEDDHGATELNVWGGYYDLDLYSNFTYFLENEAQGDQFNQRERRWMAGASLLRRRQAEWLGLPVEWRAGMETRHDWIDGIGLHQTRLRERTGTTREDDVFQGSLGAFGSVEARPTPWARGTLGLRADGYCFDVASDNPANSGTVWSGILSPKAGLVLGPWHDTEFYLNAGTGFHSNDARGVNTRVDAASGDPVARVDPLVRTYGGELGLRTQALPGLTSTLALFYLRSDSELVYVGDAGTNEAGPGSERYGLEWANYWRPAEWLTLDTELALAESRFRIDGPDRIPNSVPFMFSGGLTLGGQEGFFGALRTRIFSPRPLEESGDIESDDSFLVNARLGYRHRGWEIALECLNLFDRGDNDIEYFYASRLPGETRAYEDRHLHPAEPRTFRIAVTYRF